MHDTIWILIPLTALAIPMVAILSRPLGRWIALQEKKHEASVRTRRRPGRRARGEDRTA